MPTARPTTARDALAAFRKRIAAAQRILPGIEADGVFGPKTRSAEAQLVKAAEDEPDSTWPPSPGENPWRKVKATSFADPADVAAFKKCKKQGGSDTLCFAYGDNGEGCWGDDTTGPLKMVALPPEDMIEKWGSVGNAKHQRVAVRINGREVSCILGDRMPSRKNIKNGAGIDLNPATCRAFNLKPPVEVAAEWRWDEEAG